MTSEREQPTGAVTRRYIVAKEQMSVQLFEVEAASLGEAMDAWYRGEGELVGEDWPPWKLTVSPKEADLVRS